MINVWLLLQPSLIAFLIKYANKCLVRFRKIFKRNMNEKLERSNNLHFYLLHYIHSLFYLSSWLWIWNNPMIFCTDFSLFYQYFLDRDQFMFKNITHKFSLFTQVSMFICCIVQRPFQTEWNPLLNSQIPITSTSLTCKVPLVHICEIEPYIPNNLCDKYLFYLKDWFVGIQILTIDHSHIYLKWHSLFNFKKLSLLKWSYFYI